MTKKAKTENIHPNLLSNLSKTGSIRPQSGLKPQYFPIE